MQQACDGWFLFQVIPKLGRPRLVYDGAKVGRGQELDQHRLMLGWKQEKYLVV